MTMRNAEANPTVRRNPAPTRRRTGDAKQMRQQRCRLGSALAGEPKATPEAAPAVVPQEQPSDEIVPGAGLRPPVPGSTSRLFGATLAILAAIVISVLLFNQLPWKGAAVSPAALTLSASPPDSLVRGTRQGVVGPKDYFQVWHAGISTISSEDGSH